MRIALLTYSTKPRGGVVHTLALAEALARSGEQVDVWSLARNGDTSFFRPVDDAVGLRLVPLPTIEDETVGARVLRSLRVLGEAFAADAHGYDVVHAEDCISANAALTARDDVIRTVHHIDSFTTPELVACHEKALREPVAHVCVSQAVAGELQAGWDRTAEVIVNGVDAARFAAAAGDEPAAVEARRHWTDRFGRYVLSVGGIEPRKGTLDLIEALGKLRAEGREIPLVIAGGDTVFDYRDYRSAVGRRAAELGVRPCVLGPVPHDDLPGLVAAASVFAFPSRQEGFGLAAMEALAAGVPLVARDLPVLREVLGPAARLASGPDDFARAIAECLDATAPSETARDSTAPNSTAPNSTEQIGRELAGRHSWDGAAVAHLEFYRRLSDAGTLRQPTAAASARPLALENR